MVKERRTYESPMDFEMERKGHPNPDSPWLKHVSRDGWDSLSKSTSIFGSPSKLDTPIRSSTVPALPTTSVFQYPPPNFRLPRGTVLSSSTEPSEPASVKDASDAPNAAGVLQLPQRLYPNSSGATPPLHGLRLTDNAREKILFSTTERVSGRGELRRGGFTEAINKRVTKRKQQKSVDYWGGISLPRRSWPRSDSTDDEDASEEHHGKPQPVLSPMTKATVLNQSRWDHYFPILLSSYLQLFFNIFIVMVVLYLTTSFLLTIRADVNTKVKQYSFKRQLEIDECSQKFVVNRCNGGYRAPALEELCSRWEECMSQDPDEVGRARVSAQTFAEILNSLIDPISFKTMFFCTILVVGCVGITNAAFGIYRAKMTASHPDRYVPPPPPTPIPNIPIHPHASWAAWSISSPSGKPRAGMGWAPGEATCEPQTPSKGGTRKFAIGMTGGEGATL